MAHNHRAGERLVFSPKIGNIGLFIFLSLSLSVLLFYFVRISSRVADIVSAAENRDAPWNIARKNAIVAPVCVRPFFPLQALLCRDSVVCLAAAPRTREEIPEGNCSLPGNFQQNSTKFCEISYAYISFYTVPFRFIIIKMQV